MQDENLNGDNQNANETEAEKIARLEEANKKLYARTKTAEGFIPDPENPGKWIKKPVIEQKLSVEQTVPKPSDILKADEFKLYRQGYSEAEIDLIMHNGGAKVLEDKKSPLYLGLEAARQQRIAEEAASKVNDSAGLSDIERQYTEADMRKMSKEDLEKIIPHAQK